tara:strand:- start:3601 stop:4131 length:531 start_codon:yes stop_codon:yes gene_type:complete
MLKIAVCGKMASGKTTLANMIVNEKNNGTVLSLATKVKDIGKELFFMEAKNRPLLQKIGMKMREIQEDVWLDYLIKSADSLIAENKTAIVVVDDVRFVNEVKKLKDNGWIIIKIEIEDELQKERLQKTYADWETHWNNRADASEAEVDKVPEEWFDFILDGSELTEFGSSFNAILV